MKQVVVVLLFLFVCVVDVQGQAARRVNSIAELEFKTERLPRGSIDIQTGVARSRFRQFEAKVYRDPSRFLEAEKAVFGWQNPTEELKIIADVQLGSSRHITYQQVFNGLPVLDHLVRVNLDSGGRVSLVLSSFTKVSQAKGEITTRPLIEKSRVIESAFQQFAGGKGRYSEPILGIVQPSSPVLAWEIIVWPANEPSEYRVQIDAQTGRVIRAIDQAISLRGHASELVVGARKRFDSGSATSLVRIDGTGKVFDPSPLYTAGVNYGGAYVDAEDATNASLDATSKNVELRGITLNSANKYVLKGPYVSITGLNQGGTQVYTPPAEASKDGFQYTRNQSGFEAVNAYYHLDKSQRYIQSLGIQGRQSNPISVNPQGLTSDDSFFYPASNMIMFGTGGVDDAEDPTVLWHEYAHALLEASSPGILSTQEGAAFHEGWADYWAASYLRSQVDSGESKRTDWRKLFAWDSGDGTIWAGRTLNHQGVYPQGICVTSGGSCNVHNDGLMWATTMMEVFDQLGRDVTDRLSLLSHAYLVAPIKFSDAAEAVIQADLDYYDGANVQTLVEIFSRRGLVTASNYAPVLTHTELPDTEMLGGEVDVKAQAIGVSAPISKLELFVESTSMGVKVFNMSNVDGNKYQVALALPSQLDSVFYYFRAEDTGGRVSVLPENAPTGRFKFVVGRDEHPPVVVHDPISDAALIRWPLQIDATVTDNFSLSSVAAHYSVQDATGGEVYTGEVVLQSNDSEYSGKLAVPFSVLKKGMIVSYYLRAIDGSIAKNEARVPESGTFQAEVTAAGDLRLSDFESAELDLWASTGVWQKGAPTYGKTKAWTGVALVGTNLNGAYPNEAGQSSIEFESINLKDVDQSFLSFWHFYDTEHDGTVMPDGSNGTIWDGGVVQVSTQTQPAWTSLAPIGGYPGTFSSDLSNPLHGGPGFGGYSFGWVFSEFVLPQEDNVKVRLLFASNATNTQFAESYAGWLVDRIKVSTTSFTDTVKPVIVEQPNSQLVASVDAALPTIRVEVEDNTGVVSAIMYWTYTSASGTTTGSGRLYQDAADRNTFSKQLTMAPSAGPGDRIDYYLELKDPAGNTVRAPSGSGSYSVVFRKRDSINPLVSVWASGGWASLEDVWTVYGQGNGSTATLNLNPIQVPSNAVTAKLYLDHSYSFGAAMAGQLEVSDNGGSTWVVQDPIGNYPGRFLTGNVPSMSGELAFIGGSRGRIESEFDIQAQSGEQLLVRMTAGSSIEASSNLSWSIFSIDVRFETEDDTFDVPLTFEVLPPYPNPFRNRSNVAFVLKEPSEVDIRLYDVMGREVAFVYSGNITEGSHRVDLERNMLSSGVYLLRVRAGSQIRTRKVVIVD